MYVKHSARINNKEELANAVRQFAVQHGGLTDAGNISSPTQFSLRNANGWHFNFNFTDETIETTCTSSKPNFALTKTGTYQSSSKQTTSYNYATTYRLQFPLVSLHMISMGKQVVIVLEIANQVFRHHIFGNMETFGNVDGGEFIGGTNAKYNYNYSSSFSRTDLSQSSFADKAVTNYEFQSPLLFGCMSSTTRTLPDVGSFIRNGNEFIVLSYISFRPNRYNDSTIKTGVTYGRWTTNFVNTYNGRVQLYPYIVMYNYGYNNTQNPAIPFAYSNDIFYVNCQNIEPAEIINENYIVFPACTKLTTNMEFQTGNLGFAYRIK